jgi:hypothetical protein
LLPFVGQSGNFVTELVLTRNSLIPPFDLISYSTVFMKYWAGLNSSADQEMIRRGADNLLAIAVGARSPRRGDALHIEGARSSQADREGYVDGNAQDTSNNRSV